MAIASSSVPLGRGAFDLDVTTGSIVRARLAGRSPCRGLWIADKIVIEAGSDPIEAHRAFARALAAACAPSGGDVLVIETPESGVWQSALLETGFLPGPRKVFVERRLDDDLPPAPSHWRLRSLLEAGETAFVARMFEASEGDPFEERKGGKRDLDREWRDLVEGAGARFDPARWKLVDDERGPVGVVLPHAVNAETGTLSYVGVVPSRRRVGLGSGLHALGLRLLAAEGLRRYVGSTDVRNAAMRAVFAKNVAPVTGTEAYFRWSEHPPK